MTTSAQLPRDTVTGGTPPQLKPPRMAAVGCPDWPGPTQPTANRRAPA
ncbi:MAG: hypothetical protein QOD87_2428, partial [Pseudonocardiales bacterium]|nr:hypothetical protein [Pseudonocardiales bacterium]